MAAEHNYQWLRPATMVESAMDEAQKSNFLLTSYMVTLSSAAPLQDDHVRKALIHLYRKVPTLRLCFRLRGETLWACQMDREEIDFKVVEFTDPLRLVEDMLTKGFDSFRGPLWRARLLRPKEGMQCPMPELQAAFPHTRVLIFGNHHGIADGTSNLRITDLFLQILDDVIGGKAIDDAEQLGECDGGEETDKLLSAMKAKLEQDQKSLQDLLEEEKKKSKESTLTVQAFPPSEGAEVRTKVMIEDLDKDTTRDFLKKCKDEGVTVHSGFTALLNGTMVDIFEEAGIKQEAYRMKELHTLNLRRYWPKDTPPALGCHISLFQNYMETPAQWRNNFWQYARTVHQNLHKLINELSPIVEYFVMYKLLEDDLEAKFQEELVPEHEYITANLRNVDWLVPTDGEHVRMTHLVRTTGTWKDCWLHMFQTLRGHFLYCLCYSSHIITEQTARRFVDTLFKNLKSVI